MSVRIGNMMNKKGNLLYYLCNNYYIILIIGYIFSVFLTGFRVGIFLTIYTMIMFILFLPNLKISKSVIPVYLLLIWSMLSIIISLKNETNLSIIFQKYAAAILPILFYLFSINAKNDKCKDRFYNSFGIALMITFLLGLYWYIALPSYYVSYMEEIGYSFYLESYLSNRRFVSLFGSIGVGLFSVCGEILFLNLYFDKNKNIYLIGCFCMIIMGLLTMQRSAYIFLILFFIIIILKQKGRNRKKAIKLLFLFIAAFIMITLIFLSTNSDILKQIFDRIDNINIESLFGTRINQWQQIENLNALELLIGKGIGYFTNGSEGVNINDGAYFNILGEMGIIGFCLYFYVIISAINRCITSHNNRYKSTQLLIVFAFLMNAIGSNGLLYMPLASIFWYALGDCQVILKIKKG